MKIIPRFATACPCWTKNLRQQALSPGDPNADSNYQEYYRRFAKRDFYLILHSLGCARASADYQSDRWNQTDNNNAIAHAVIDSNDGDVRQNLEWGMYGWHVGSKGNKLSIGIEMCESDAIKYDQPKSWQFSILDETKAKRHCRTTYASAVELFAMLCKTFGLDPTTRILSHKEACAKGIASDHGDPEHYWKGLGMNYTMNGFRSAVRDKIEAENQMPFADVPDGKYYTDDVRWAWENGIVSGTDPTHFSPKENIKRCDNCVMMHRLYDVIIAQVQEMLRNGG